ncbi:DUF1611 domain-containing protein [Pseudemcibacter aquimaris]|uniref:DUF1611 domain-containing protein n=1 Tax=Pseudemcibacter aquimaris TaxID=2857064 RepID=UPI002011E157|nr:DUF1611 domain-containing protein [Pseudemcibacter aquimaris]MCC3861082.1 DUF1611 domain-containing protein [Pseudemcibacter aquimaris]WDU59900.1 DUF1611 domain-containing protein [Pseudemcibacter aquimaris]
MITIEIKPPYLIFVGDETDTSYAKTGAGLIEWRPELCVGQIGINGGGIDGAPHMTIQEAKEAGVKSLVIGTAAIGGGVPDVWLDTLEEALAAGMDIVAGVHQLLNDNERLVAAAKKSGSRLIDVRVPPKDIPVGTGKKRSGKRILMVGTDCAIGKKYSALAIEKDMKKAGLNADFRASGQTGIMIAGRGIPIDCVVADFISGAAEMLSPDNTDDHWDVVEGQGGIYHPGYSGVTMGLLVGSQPDAFVVCHDAVRTHISGWDDFPLPSIQDVINRVTEIGKQVNPDIRCVGICVNTSQLGGETREKYLSDLSAEYGLPCVDPIIDGTMPIVEQVKSEFPE